MIINAIFAVFQVLQPLRGGSAGAPDPCSETLQPGRPDAAVSCHSLPATLPSPSGGYKYQIYISF